MEVIKDIGQLFYIELGPGESVPNNIENLRDYSIYTQGTLYFLFFIILEFILQWIKKKPMTRFNDSIVSLSHGIYYDCAKVLIRGTEGYMYIQIYNNWRICDLPFNSPTTWYIAALGVDFVFYWMHRASHEISLLWGFHQVHHSSEEFNLTTALRQSAIQRYLNWIFYLPLALIIPPSVFLIHQQFNILYKFWIHTEIIDSIGPLEYILNTPKHHRIHHGSNLHCLDKNYGGVFIIWDRMFGTFAEEKPNEKIVYGLVEHVRSFNPFFLQFHYFPSMLEKISTMTNFGDKLSVIFKGPSWSPGKPRTGDDAGRSLAFSNGIFPIREKFDVDISLWQNVYILFNFVVIWFVFHNLLKHNMILGQLNALCCVIYILFTLSSIGFILENRKIAVFTEIFRCTVCICITLLVLETQSVQRKLLLNFFGISISIWIFVGLLTISHIHQKQKPKQG